ncbi:unnamed protein product [Microthlaspi erraticum]|nr:unnamed protein product [Microthlaspi erraticum]
MLLWAIDNPAPANFMLISGDRDFSNALHQLSMRRYTILLARPPRASAPLVAAAKNVWLWTSLASGGPPLTSVESSLLVNSGRCHVSNSNYQVSKDPVSKPALFSKPTGSTDHKVRENNVPRGKAKRVQEAEVLEPLLCTVRQIICTNKDGYVKHTYGKRHRHNLELLSGKSGNISWGTVEIPKEVLEKEKKASEVVRAKPNGDFACRMCNVVCQSQVVFASHLRGQKHITNLCQSEALTDSKKLQEEGVGAKDQPKETIAEAKPSGRYDCSLCNVVCQSQVVSDSHLRGHRHAAALLSQSKALVDSKKLQEKDVAEKDQPSETIAETQSLSQTPQENTKFLEKQNEELRETCGTTEISVKESFPCTKDTVNKQFPNGEVPREGSVKPVNLSQGANKHLREVKKKQIEMMAAFVASDDAQSSVSTKHVKEAEDLQPVWCQVCQIMCNSKVVYANHTYGKKHRHKLELLSAKNENMSKGPAKLSKENAEKKKKEHVDSRRTRQEIDQEKPGEALEKKLIVDSMKIQEESDLEKETTEEHTLINTDDLGLQVAQEDKEEVKEINAISENLAPAFSEPSRESRMPKESRGCLDVIPERVQVAPDGNVTEKLEYESKHKPEIPGRREQPAGEVAKRENVNFWTLFWGKKS